MSDEADDGNTKQDNHFYKKLSKAAIENAKAFNEFKEQKARSSETFLKDVPDLFTSEEYNNLLDRIYRGKSNYPNLKDDISTISKNEFKALVSTKVLELLDYGFDCAETLSLTRMFGRAIDNDKRGCTYEAPKNYKADMGGKESERNQDLCAGGVYMRMDGSGGDVICALQEILRKGSIGSVHGVYKIEKSTDGTNDLYKICPHLRGLEKNECEKLREDLCDLHSRPIKLKLNHYEPIDDFMQREYNETITQVINIFDDSSLEIDNISYFEMSFEDKIDYIDNQVKIIAKKVCSELVNGYATSDNYKDDVIPGYI